MVFAVWVCNLSDSQHGISLFFVGMYPWRETLLGRYNGACGTVCTRKASQAFGYFSSDVVILQGQGALVSSVLLFVGGFLYLINFITGKLFFLGLMLYCLRLLLALWFLLTSLTQ